MLRVTYVLQVKPKKNRVIRKQWQVEDSTSNLTNNINRLLGRPVVTPFVVRKILKPKPDSEFSKYSWVRLIKVSRVSWLFAISIDFEDEEGKKAKNLQKIANGSWEKHVGQSMLIIKSYSVNAVMGSVGIGIFDQNESPLDGWLHVEPSHNSDEFIFQLVRELTLRVAIEKAILTWSISSQKPLFRVIQSPFAGFLVRRWPAHLLIDSSLINRMYQQFRASLNLDPVRTEVLERAKSWWSLTISGITFLSLVLALWQK